MDENGGKAVSRVGSTVKMRYRALSTYLRERFGFRVQKIPLDAGFSCPNRDGTISRDGCVFCDARGSGTGAFSKGLSITQQLGDAATKLTKRYHAKGFIAYFQAFTNTYGPVERLRRLYDEAIRFPAVVGLSIGTRPDCLSEDVLDLLSSYAERYMVWLELGLQSAKDETLRLINRGHTFETFAEAVKRAATRGILTCAHLIIGLPGESKEDIMETARTISPLPLDGVKLHSLYIVKGTRLAQWFEQGTYRPWTQAEYANSVCDFLERIPPQWVIHRLTGDPPRGELVAPDWTSHKQQTLGLIRQLLEERNTWQGRLFRSIYQDRHAATPLDRDEWEARGT